MTETTEIESFVKEFGESYRDLIVSALQYLDEEESKWALDKPIDRRAYIRDLLERIG
jgi:hypothetical protein